MHFHLRQFVEADYASVTRLHNLTFPDFEKFVEQFRHNDETYPPEARWVRWTVLDDEDSVIGYAQYSHIKGLFDPHKFAIDVAVDPRYEHRGIGSRLYETLLTDLAPLEPTSLACWAREDQGRLREFLGRRGFEPNSSMYTSSIDLRGFDASRWADRERDVAVQGIAIRSLGDLGDAEGVRRGVYDLWCEVRQDLPIPPGEILNPPMSCEEFWGVTSGPALFAPGYFVALDGERYVGTSQLWLSPVDGVLRTGLTGVRRAYRRRGIATAMKVHALRFARELGYRCVVTDNAAENEGMLAINGQLGFCRNPPWTRYLKTF